VKLDLDRTPTGRSELAVDSALMLGLERGGPDTVRVAGNLEVQNLEQRFLVRGTLRASGAAECGRCLREFSLAYEVPVDIVVLRDTASDEGEDDNLVIHQRAGEVDLTDALRESAILAAPQVKVCDPGCRGLCPRCGADLNAGDCGCSQRENDPRWDDLPSA
jgi:uncharacterized protein